ncbi:MAG: hypothetical protein KBA33_09880 [Cloacibacterium sp.]|nr:hypothetical protein [Cloacibacterium sp.]
MPNLFDAEKLALESFKIISENIFVPEFFDESLIKEFGSTNQLSISFNLEQKLIRAEFDFEILTKSESSEEAKANYKFVLIYSCSNLEELAHADGEELKVNSQLGFAISAISYSTIRGILLIKLSETVFQDFILPIIKPNLPN